MSVAASAGILPELTTHPCPSQKPRPMGGNELMYGIHGIRTMSRTNAATRFPAACNVKKRRFATLAHTGYIGRENKKSELASTLMRHAACTDGASRRLARWQADSRSCRSSAPSPSAVPSSSFLHGFLFPSYGDYYTISLTRMA